MNNPGPFDGVTNPEAVQRIQEHVARANEARRARRIGRKRCGDTVSKAIDRVLDRTLPRHARTHPSLQAEAK